LQTAYADKDLPSEVRVTFAPHPLAGRDLKVIDRRKKGCEFFWRVELPDGSCAELPSSWTGHCAASAPKRSPQVKTRTSPKALWELMRLLKSLVSP
jgi:hypothetical protein